MSQNSIAIVHQRFQEPSPPRSTLRITRTCVLWDAWASNFWSTAAHAVLMMLAGWIRSEEEAVVGYQKEEIRALREMLGGKRLRFTEVQLSAGSRPMSRFALHHADIVFIAENIRDEAIAARFNKLAREQEASRRALDLCLADHERQSMLQALTDLFSESGIGEDGEPNAFGYRIESMIDLFANPKG